MSLQDEGLLWGVALVGAAVFFLHGRVVEGKLLCSLDSLRLAVFAALGAQTGLSAGLGLWGVVFTGAVSGVGGGVLRDLLTGQVPGILYGSGDLYATAAFGALTVFLLQSLGEAALVAGTLVTLALRIGSRLLGLELPVPRDPGGA